MKELLGAIAIGSVALTAGLAAAKDSGRAERMFERVDTDGDGRITQAEAQAFHEARFARMDVDGDGAITEEEMLESARKRLAERMAHRFERLDADGNGVIERVEFVDRAAAQFQRMDSDGDGTITLEEVRARKGRRGG